jgi:hypothetical protein
MKYVMRLCAFFCALFLSVPVFGATFYEQGHTEAKARNEIIWGAGLPGLQYQPSTDTDINTEWWFGFSVYFATDEGTVGWYDYNHDYYIAQPFSLNSSTGSASPEVNFVKQPGNDGYTYVQYRISGGSETPSSKLGFVPRKDGWNDFVLHYKRDPTNTGYMKIWLNGEVIHDRVNAPSAIYNHPSMRFKAGFYYAALNSPHRYVLYYDNIRIGDETSSFAEVDPAGTLVCPSPDPRCTPVNPGTSIDTVNGGTAVPSSTLIPFTATATESIIGCQIGALPESFVNWDYTGNASGQFNTGDLSSLTSATQTLKCYAQPHLSPINMVDTAWSTTSTTDNGTYSGSRYGYTTGLVIEKTVATEYADTRIGIPDIVTNVIGDKQQFDFTYSCLSGHCDDLYFAVEDETSSPYERLTAEGTAGALTLGTLNSGIGSVRSITNRTLGDNVYRVIIAYTATVAANKYKLRAGTRNGTMNQIVTLHEVIPRKNPTTTTIEKQITIAGTDTDNPDLSDCSIQLTPSSEFSGTNNAVVSCTTSEIGGEYFVMLKDTNAAPADADVVIAGTGALRSATGTVDSLTISAEFSGLAYQDLWAYAVHRDAATLKSTVATATFDATIKRIKFLSNTARLRTITGAEYTGPLDFFLLTNSDPRLPGTKNDLVYIDNPSISNGVINFTETNVQCATCTGSINALNPGQYWYSTRSEDGSVKSVYTINVVAE